MKVLRSKRRLPVELKILSSSSLSPPFDTTSHDITIPLKADAQPFRKLSTQTSKDNTVDTELKCFYCMTTGPSIHLSAPTAECDVSEG